MADAIKCDICGKYSDDYGLSVNLRIRTIQEEKDVCQACGKKIAEFIEENLMNK